MNENNPEKGGNSFKYFIFQRIDSTERCLAVALVHLVKLLVSQNHGAFIHQSDDF